MKKLKLSFVSALLENRELWWRLTERAVTSRFKGSALGFGWSLVQPLLMLAVYTFVFSTIFRSRWGGLEEAGSLGYAVNLFAGLIVFNLFAECMAASPGLVVNNKNYVTKVIFPLELLGASAVSAATIQAVTSTVILIGFELLAFHRVPITVLWLPFVWIPLLLACLTLSWTFSTLGVFVRDLEQMVPLMLNVALFLSAVFYPIESLPAQAQQAMKYNPLAIIILETRQVAIVGNAPSWGYLVLGSLMGVVACEISYRGFQHARRGFADVL